MKTRSMVVAVLCVVACLCVTSAFSARAGKDGGTGGFAIYVAPGTIATNAQCTWVTIHTDVSFSSVVLTGDAKPAAAVDGKVVTIQRMFADDCGNLVAKLAFAEVVDIVETPAAVVELTLTLKDADPEDDPLSASETVPVKD